MESQMRPDAPSVDRSSEDEPAGQPVAKRARVAHACRRCKTRKQKCDGSRPACSSCARLDVECRYIIPLVPTYGEKKMYITALEDRVAELENLLASMGQFGVGDDHWGRVQSPTQAHDFNETDDVESLFDAVRDLSLSASGHYIGGTSTITMGRILGSVVSSQRASRPGLERQYSPGYEDPNPKSVSTATLAGMMGPMFVAPGVAARLVEGFLKHIATRFPVIHTPRLREIFERKDALDSIYEESILHLVYATGGRFLETTGETGNFFCDQHYEAALQHMDAILQLRDTRSLSYLLLLGIYCLRAPKDPGAWALSGLAMRLCIELGLHRRSKGRIPSLQGELEKRIFWSCYYLDREVSIALGRPPAISDNDIDTELPLDIDENVDDSEVIIGVSKHICERPVSPPTSLTSFVHHLRLKRIESEIQHTIYRVDQPMSASYSAIEGFLDRLSEWERVLPLECRHLEDSRLLPYDGIDVYMVPYYKVRRLLLYPQLSESPVNERYLELCAQACGGVCESYKSLHHSMNVGFSPLSLQSVFLAGLTLIYCLWLSPSLMIKPNYTTGSLTDCSIMLYVMTERFPSARKYRDVFERIKNSVLAMIEQQKQQPARKLSLGNDLRTRCHRLASGLEMGGAKEEFNWMIGKMTGSGASGSQVLAPLQAQQSDSEINSQDQHGYLNRSDGYVGFENDWPTTVVDIGDLNGDYSGWGAAGRM